MNYKIKIKNKNIHKYFHPSSLNQLIYAHNQCWELKKGQQKVPILRRRQGFAHLEVFTVCLVRGRERGNCHVVLVLLPASLYGGFATILNIFTASTFWKYNHEKVPSLVQDQNTICQAQVRFLPHQLNILQRCYLSRTWEITYCSSVRNIFKKASLLWLTWLMMS